MMAQTFTCRWQVTGDDRDIFEFCPQLSGSKLRVVGLTLSPMPPRAKSVHIPIGTGRLQIAGFEFLMAGDACSNVAPTPPAATLPMSSIVSIWRTYFRDVNDDARPMPIGTLCELRIEAYD